MLSVLFYSKETSVLFKYNYTLSVDGQVISSIGKGLCVLVGIGRKDASKHADWM